LAHPGIKLLELRRTADQLLRLQQQVGMRDIRGGAVRDRARVVRIVVSAKRGQGGHNNVPESLGRVHSLNVILPIELVAKASPVNRILTWWVGLGG
jgi:hypothetical protein